MPIIEKDFGPKGKPITIEFDDNFEKDYVFPNKAAKQIFIKTLFFELKKLIRSETDCHDFSLANILCEKNQAQVFLTRKNNIRKLYHVIVTYPDMQLEQKSETLPCTRDNLKIIRELDLDEKEFQQWKKESAHVIEQANNIFDICQTQIKQNFFVVNAHAKAAQKKQLAGDAEDIRLNQSVDEFNEKLGDVNIDVICLEEIHALRIEMQEQLEQGYAEHRKKICKLIEQKEHLLQILRLTAIDYYRMISPLDKTLWPGYRDHFNMVFADVARIEGEQLISKELNSQKMLLKNVVVMFNQIFMHLNTMYYRWTTRPEPLTTLVTYLENYLQSCNPPSSAPVQYADYHMTFPVDSMKQEMQIMSECEILKKALRFRLHETLARQKAILQKVQESYQKKLAVMAKYTLAIANYVEVKNFCEMKPAYVSLDAAKTEPTCSTGAAREEKTQTKLGLRLAI